MSVILNSLNAHYFLIFQPILVIVVSKFMVYRALSDNILIIRVAIPFTPQDIDVYLLFIKHT